MIPYSNSPFERTICDCRKCTQHCHEQPGSCAPGDYERIAAYLGKSPSEVADLFVAAPGATIENSLTGETKFIQTITPATVRGTSRCVFLDKDNRCSIHPVSPFGCAAFDHHMGPRESNARSAWMIKAIERSFTYTLLRDTLPLTRVYNPRGYDPTPIRKIITTEHQTPEEKAARSLKRLLKMLFQ